MHLAQLNIARLIEPIDSPRLADFVANLDRINALAENSPGFVWRFQTSEGDATGAEHAFGDDMIVNLSVWESVEALRAYVFESDHVAILRRRRDWFRRMDMPHAVLWWIPGGHHPDVSEAADRLAHLTEHGATEAAFTFGKPFPAISA